VGAINRAPTAAPPLVGDIPMNFLKPIIGPLHLPLARSSLRSSERFEDSQTLYCSD
jgi:hypothetical protein